MTQGDVNQLHRALQELGRDLDARLDRIEERVYALDEAIRGNGKPGLRASHHSLQQRVNGLAALLRWTVGVLTTVGTAIAIWAVTRH